MPQNQSIVIKDGASTPVNHTYMPSKIDSNNVATFQERVSGVPVGYPTLTWSLRAPSPQSATYKMVGKLTLPKVVSATDSSGVSVMRVDYTNIGTIELVVSSRSTKQERTDLRAQLQSLLAAPAIVTSADDLESFW